MYTRRTQKITKEQYKEALSHLIDLKEGWDRYGADTISEKVIDTVSEFLANTTVVPGVNGDLQIEWHACGYDIEISFNNNAVIDNIAVDKPAFDFFNSTNRSCSFRNSGKCDVEIVVDYEGNFGSFDLYMENLR